MTHNQLTPSRRKRAAFIAAAGLLLLQVGGHVATAAEPVDIQFGIGGPRLAIPPGYLLQYSAPSSPTAVGNALLFAARLPDISPRTPATATEFETPAAGKVVLVFLEYENLGVTNDAALKSILNGAKLSDVLHEGMLTITPLAAGGSALYQLPRYQNIPVICQYKYSSQERSVQTRFMLLPSTYLPLLNHGK